MFSPRLPPGKMGPPQLLQPHHTPGGPTISHPRGNFCLKDVDSARQIASLRPGMVSSSTLVNMGNTTLLAETILSPSLVQIVRQGRRGQGRDRSSVCPCPPDTPWDQYGPAKIPCNEGFTAAEFLGWGPCWSRSAAADEGAVDIFYPWSAVVQGGSAGGPGGILPALAPFVGVCPAGG